MLVSQKSLCGKLQNVTVCTIVFLLAHVVQEKNTGSGLKKCLCVHTECCFYTVQEKNACEWTEKMSVHAHKCSCLSSAREKSM